MSVIYQIPKQQLLEEGFTHSALAFGFIPVWTVGDSTENITLIATRNWVPDWLLEWAINLAEFFSPNEAYEAPIIPLSNFKKLENLK